MDVRVGTKKKYDICIEILILKYIILYTFKVVLLIFMNNF